MLMMSRQDEERLGLPQVLEACGCRSPQGRKLKAERRYYAPSERALLEKEFDAIDRLVAVLRSDPRIIRRAFAALGRFRDLKATLSGLENGRLLEVTEFFEIKQALGLFRELAEMTPLLEKASVVVAPIPRAEALLDPGGRQTSGFYLYDEYSPRLAELRKERALLEKRLEKQTGSPEASAREERLAERAALVAAEDAEETAVRARLTDQLQEHLEALRENFRAVGVLDFRLARAVLADEWQAGKPVLLDEGEPARLTRLYHPVMEAYLKERGTAFVRQSITIRRGTTVISGPNMGGKSVALKSVTLALALLHLGYFPPASYAAAPLYDFISYHSDYLDETRRGLSSFGAEVVRMRDDIARSRQAHGLVVMDEPCRGTNPEEATALVGALARFYSALRGSLVCATHYRVPAGEGVAHVRIRGIRPEALATFDPSCAGDGNVSLLSAEQNSGDAAPACTSDQLAISRIEALMDYRLEEVDGQSPVPADALRIAEMLGLDREVLALIEEGST